MAATALAIRLYELDHSRRPETLAQLVPDYLPAVPKDPFIDNLQPIRYLPNTEPPVLYSVGYDAIDCGGQENKVVTQIIEKKRTNIRLGKETHTTVHEADIVFFLNGNRPERIKDLGAYIRSPEAHRNCTHKKVID